jgi:ferredoxin-type protein NapG
MGVLVAGPVAPTERDSHQLPMKRRALLKYGLEVAGVTALGVGAVESGVLSGADTPLVHPPGAPAEDEFLSNCIKCGRCIQECPPNALGFAELSDGILRSGSPKLTPETAGCIAWDEPCLECIDACPTNSLHEIATDDAGIPTEEIIGRAQIDDARCINCANCYPACPTDAVLKHDKEAGRETFAVDTEGCVGCGRCIEVCPVEGKAVALFPPDAEPEYPIDMEVTH